MPTHKCSGAAHAMSSQPVRQAAAIVTAPLVGCPSARIAIATPLAVRQPVASRSSSGEIALEAARLSRAPARGWRDERAGGSEEEGAVAGVVPATGGVRFKALDT